MATALNGIQYVPALTFDEALASTVIPDSTGRLEFSKSIIANVVGNVTQTSLILPAPVVTAADTIAVTAALSGTTYFATKASATQVFTLPAPAVGLTYTFVCGHADGEIRVAPLAAGQTITGIGFAVTHPTGIKNTTATNVVGDAVTLVAVSTTAWVASVTTGTWATV